MERGIRVTGAGQASGPRDECVLTVGAEVRRPGAAAALAACTEVVRRMRAVFDAAGLPESALATSSVSLNPVYDQYPTVAGFQAGLQLTATTEDLATVGGLLADLVTAGGDEARVHEVTFRHRDPAALVARAREAAWADALARASQLAALAGRELGEVVLIDEAGAHPHPPGPLRAMAAADAGGGVPLDAGEGSVLVSLTVGWALR
jgi:hypothetical protein